MQEMQVLLNKKQKRKDQDHAEKDAHVQFIHNYSLCCQLQYLLVLLYPFRTADCWDYEVMKPDASI